MSIKSILEVDAPPNSWWVINTDLVIIPSTKRILLGRNSKKDVYHLLREAWKDKEGLRKFGFPLRVKKILSLTISVQCINGWTIE